jgi:hypothetical protein
MVWHSVFSSAEKRLRFVVHTGLELEEYAQIFTNCEESMTPEQIIEKWTERLWKLPCVFGGEVALNEIEAELQPLTDLIRAAQEISNSSDYQDGLPLTKNLRAALEKLGSI